MEDPELSSNRVNDINHSFREIFPSPESMREQMVEIAKHSFCRSHSQPQDWIDKMHFLIKHQSEDEVIPCHESSVIENVPALPDSSSPIASSSGVVLKLVERSSLPDPAAYVAVSYCLNRENVEWYTGDIKAPIEILRKNTGKRPSTVPPDVLHRSVAYATNRGVNAIWIDQESVNQDDPIDKENSIQVMDIIYQDSQHPIAILEFFFQSQIEVDVFTSVVDFDFVEFDPNQIEVLEDVLFRLSQDSWFSRAWTLQESTSAGASMIILLGSPGLDKYSYFDSTPGEFEISIWDFQNAMVNSQTLIEERLAAETWSDTTSAIYASNYASILYNYIPNIHPKWVRSGKRDASHRQRCSAAEALNFLDDRSNSVFPDRLAILANICNYEVRIKTMVLELLGCSFSACALVLAILNGDMSLLAGCQAIEAEASSQAGKAIWLLDQAKDGRCLKPPFYRNDDTDSSAITYGFSWGPKSSGSLNNITYLEECGDLFRLKPASLSKYGLKVCGILWEISQPIKVPKTRREFVSKRQEELDCQVTEFSVLDSAEEWASFREQDKRQNSLLRDFSWSLVHELIDSGHIELAKTVWNYIQPFGKDIRGWRSKFAERPYPFETIFGSLNHRIESDISKSYDESDVTSGLSAGSFSSNSDRHPTILMQILNQICESEALVCGIPVKYPNHQELRVWFESCKEGDLVFTPITHMGDNVMCSSYRSEAVSWRVSRTGNAADGCEILHCFGRRRGLYRFEGLEPQVCLLE